MGALGPDEVAITTTNRNFKGRMGSSLARVYLANAYVAACAAVAGEIVDPEDSLGESAMIIEGRALIIPGNNVDTDGLYPGAYLNLLAPDEMKLHLFEGLDRSLLERVRGDTILVVGRNFGTGSSREHVQVAMKACGIRAVVGESFARIFYRNCVNLGLTIVQLPGVIDRTHTGSMLRIDTVEGTIDVDGERLATPGVPRLVEEIIREEGLVHWVRTRLASRSENT